MSEVKICDTSLPCPDNAYVIMQCNTRVREGRRVNKRARFCRKKIAYFLIPEYAARLKVPNSLNLKIDKTRCARAIAAFWP